MIRANRFACATKGGAPSTVEFCYDNAFCLWRGVGKSLEKIAQRVRVAVQKCCEEEDVIKKNIEWQHRSTVFKLCSAHDEGVTEEGIRETICTVVHISVLRQRPLRPTLTSLVSATDEEAAALWNLPPSGAFLSKADVKKHLRLQVQEGGGRVPVLSLWQHLQDFDLQCL